MKKKAIIIGSCCTTLLLAVCIFFMCFYNQKPVGVYYRDADNSTNRTRNIYIIYTDGTYDWLGTDAPNNANLYSGTWELTDGILTFKDGISITNGNYNYNAFSNSFEFIDKNTHDVWKKQK